MPAPREARPGAITRPLQGQTGFRLYPHTDGSLAQDLRRHGGRPVGDKVAAVGRRACPGSRHHVRAPAGRPVRLVGILAEAAKLCMVEAAGANGPRGLTAAGAVTARYETFVRPPKRERDSVGMASRGYLKIPHNRRPGTADHTGVGDCLRQRHRRGHVAARVGRDEAAGLLPEPSVFHADRAYDSKYNCSMPFEMGIIPNIRQRSASANRGKPHRSGPAKIFEEGWCCQRGIIEGAFGGGVSKRHRTHCRFGKIRATAWNAKALNQLRCARMRGMEVPSDSTMP